MLKLQTDLYITSLFLYIPFGITIQQEALRLFPSVPFIGRRIEDDTNIGMHAHGPEGMLSSLSVTSLCRIVRLSAGV